MKEAKQGYPASVWDQEYECSFEAMEDAVFKEAVIQSCIKEVLLETSGQPVYYLIIMGTNPDVTVIKRTEIISIHVLPAVAAIF
ncbi:hypothetical protein LCGC14_2523310 [marine sediment metagenome]|uniref:Uncharacterized protein n=1 Tax=marine sediment metagenome TaxID=412755 RepID=A0A0F9D7B6_9ZZZZ